MDAAEGDAKHQKRHAAIHEKFEKGSGTKILCVPARFRRFDPEEVARLWVERGLSIIIANYQTSSVIRLENKQPWIAPSRSESYVHLESLANKKD
jgi:hypothetical protein